MQRPDFDIFAGAYLSAALGVLLLPLNWLLSAAVAMTVHELGHLAALKCCHIPVVAIKLGAFGAGISTGPMDPKQEILCAAAGPLCSLALFLFADQSPVLALIGLVQGVFNLLPVYPMDGGRIVKAIAEILREMMAS